MVGTEEPNHKPWNSHRYMAPVYVLLGPWHPKSKINIIDHFGQLSLQPANLVLFTVLGNNEEEYAPQVYEEELRNSPASKLLLSWSDGTLQIMPVQNDHETFHPPLELLPTSPLEYHKAKNWNGCRRKLLTVVSFRYGDFLDKFRTNLKVCLWMLRYRSRSFSHCTTDIVDVAYLAQIHNLSLVVREKHKYWGKTIQHKERQFVETSFNHYNYSKLDKSFLAGLYFARYESEKALYCEKLNQNEEDSMLIAASIWVIPFTPAMWVALLITNIVVLLLFYLKQNGSFLKKLGTSLGGQVSMMLGQCASSRFESKFNMYSLLIATSILFGYIGGLYQNGITSMVTAPDVPNVYENLKTLLEAQYKILWFSQDDRTDPREAHKLYYEIKHMEHMLNDSFYEVKNESFGVGLSGYKWMTKRFSVAVGSDMEAVLKSSLTRAVNPKDDKGNMRQCHIVPRNLVKHSISG